MLEYPSPSSTSKLQPSKNTLGSRPSKPKPIKSQGFSITNPVRGKPYRSLACHEVNDIWPKRLSGETFLSRRALVYQQHMWCHSRTEWHWLLCFCFFPTSLFSQARSLPSVHHTFWQTRYTVTERVGRTRGRLRNNLKRHFRITFHLSQPQMNISHWLKYER